MSENADRVYNLTVDLIQLEKDKKATTAGYNEEIKRIRKEIADYINPKVKVDTESTAGEAGE